MSDDTKRVSEAFGPVTQDTGGELAAKIRADEEAAKAEHARIDLAIANGLIGPRPPLGARYVEWSDRARALGIVKPGRATT